MSIALKKPGRTLSIAPTAAGFGLVMVLSGHVHAQQQVNRSAENTQQKADQEQAPSRPHMAVRADESRTYTSQKTQGMPQNLIDSAQPHPTFPAQR